MGQSRQITLVTHNIITPSLNTASNQQRRYQHTQFLTPFQCDICVFRLLFKRNPIPTPQDYDSIVTVRRMNLDSLWSRDPSTISANL